MQQHCSNKSSVKKVASSDFLSILCSPDSQCTHCASKYGGIEGKRVLRQILWNSLLFAGIVSIPGVSAAAACWGEKERDGEGIPSKKSWRGRNGGLEWNGRWVCVKYVKFVNGKTKEFSNFSNDEKTKWWEDKIQDGCYKEMREQALNCWASLQATRLLMSLMSVSTLLNSAVQASS